MSERMKARIGEELYKQVTEKIKPEEFDILEGYVKEEKYNALDEKYKAEIGKSGEYQKQLNNKDKLLKDNEKLLNESGDYKSKYDQLGIDSQKIIEEKDKHISNIEKRYLIQNKLSEIGARNSKLLLHEIDFDKISVENGNLLGFDSMLDSLKNEYKDFFPEQQISNNTTTNTSNNSNTNIDNKDFENEEYWDKQFEQFL